MSKFAQKHKDSTITNLVSLFAKKVVLPIAIKNPCKGCEFNKINLHIIL